MLDVYFIVSILIFAILCFFEFIVFNEEILLALCFFSFIFFAFNSLGDSIFGTFTDRAKKFETDLLLSFVSFESNIQTQYASFLLSRNLVSKIDVFSSFLTAYLNFSSKYVLSNSSYLSFKLCSSTILELTTLESRLFTEYQKKSISILLYPFIFQSTKTSVINLPIKSTNISTTKTSKQSFKVASLKTLSI
jgi:hypothetical protein